MRIRRCSLKACQHPKKCQLDSPPLAGGAPLRPRRMSLHPASATWCGTLHSARVSIPRASPSGSREAPAIRPPYSASGSGRGAIVTSPPGELLRQGGSDFIPIATIRAEGPTEDWAFSPDSLSRNKFGPTGRWGVSPQAGQPKGTDLRGQGSQRWRRSS